MTPLPTASDRFARTYEAVTIGFLLKGLEFPFVVPMSHICVTQQKHGLSLRSSIICIYQGVIDSTTSGIKNFFQSRRSHLFKEAIHCLFRASALAEKPQIDAYFANTLHGQVKADLTFATLLTAGEMAMHPLDTVRTMRQAGEHLSPKKCTISFLYKGAVANGSRQFVAWLGFPISERMASNVIEKTTSIDSHTLSGIALKAPLQSLLMTSSFWIFERLKTELQCHPHLATEKTGRYQAALKHILKRHGCSGLMSGFPVKVMSNMFPIASADYLIEQSKHRNLFPLGTALSKN